MLLPVPARETRLVRQASMKFEDMIDRIQVPLALIYGKEDPWVVPLWGHRIKRQRPETLYYQVRKSGSSRRTHTCSSAWQLGFYC